nr:hypothetical protein [Xylocopilactobacillus apis]
MLIKIYVSEMDESTEKLSEAEKAEIKEKIFNYSGLDTTSLGLYANCMSIYDLEDNLIISKRIIKKFKDNQDLKIQEALLTIIDNLLSSCIENKREDEASVFIQFADQIKTRQELLFVKKCFFVMKKLIDYHRTGGSRRL